MEWIDATTTPAPVGVPVLLTVDAGGFRYTTMGYKAMGDKNAYEGWNFYSSLHKVTHWQPAPDPAAFWRNYSEVKAS